MRGSEVTTEQVSVLPFLEALGYATHDPDEVRNQNPVFKWDKVDFAIMRAGAPTMVVEV